MRISVVGTGHVGLTTAICLASIGHEVLGVDEDEEKVQRIAMGQLPFFEPGLQPMLEEQLALGRLRVSSDVADAARGREVVLICVGTPTRPSGEPDLGQVERVGRTLAAALDGYAVVAEKSTVPVGTAAAIRRAMEASARAGVDFDVCSNPEFLQEGRAIEGTLEPSRIVVGTASDRAAAVMRELYAAIVERTGCPFITTDVETAELVKHASNAFLATKISFINQVADVCERANADVATVAAAMGLDPRIGPHFLEAGIGYGGECLPKDVQAFRYTAEQHGVEFQLLAEVDRINTERKKRFIDKIRAALGDLEDKRIAVWGLAFKPGTDDLRHAPGVEIARRLSTSGAFVRVYDPVATAAALPSLPHVEPASDPLEAARGAHCVAVCTEWPELARVDLSALRDIMARPVIVDGRNLLDPAEAGAAGFLYLGTGRPMVSGSIEAPEPR